MKTEIVLVRDTGDPVYLGTDKGRIYMLARMGWANAGNWLSPADARELAAELINAAEVIENGNGVIIRIPAPLPAWTEGSIGRGTIRCGVCFTEKPSDPGEIWPHAVGCRFYVPADPECPFCHDFFPSHSASCTR